MLADYKKMYVTLCAAVDDVIDPLERIPSAVPYAKLLRSALLQAEEIYIRTTPYAQPSDTDNIINFMIDEEK